MQVHPLFEPNGPPQMGWLALTRHALFA